jgi:hypothetical protein
MLGLLDHLWTPILHVTPLKTPFGLVIPLLQSQSNVTTITIISYAVTRLHNYHPYTFVTTITYYTLTRLHSLQTLHFNLYCTIAHKVSTLRNSRRELIPRIHFLRLLLNNWLIELLLKHWLLHSHSGNWTELQTANRFAYIAELR